MLFEKTGELEKRRQVLADEVRDLEGKAERVTRARNEAAGFGNGDVGELEAQVGEANRELATVRGGLAVVESELRVVREREGRAAALERIDAIHKEAFDNAATFEDAAQQLLGAAQHVVSLRDQFNGAYGRSKRLQEEMGALVERFDVPGKQLPKLPAPDRHPVSRDMPFSVGLSPGSTPRQPRTESDGIGRKRRTYQEVGSVGGEIIKRAGLRPWPQMTPRQEQLMEEREEQDKREAALAKDMASRVAAGTPDGGALRG